MGRLTINQSVDVYSLPPSQDQIAGVNEGELHVHSFESLIPACEFAVSLASEGHTEISLRTELERTIDLAEAQQIVAEWHSGRVALDAQQIDY